MADDSVLQLQPRRVASAGWTRGKSTTAEIPRPSRQRPASSAASTSTSASSRSSPSRTLQADALLHARVQHLESQNRELKQKLQALRRAKTSVVVVNNSNGSGGGGSNNNDQDPSQGSPHPPSSTTLPTLSASAAAAAAAAAALGSSGKLQSASSRKKLVKAKLRGKLKRRGRSSGSGRSSSSTKAPHSSQAFATAAPAAAAPEKSTSEAQTDISGSPWKHSLVFHREAFVEQHLSTQRRLEAALENGEGLERTIVQLQQRHEDREAEFKAQWDRREVWRLCARRATETEVCQMALVADVVVCFWHDGGAGDAYLYRLSGQRRCSCGSRKRRL